MADNIEQLKELLKHHDWFYNYSDDFRWYKNGQASLDTIHRLIIQSNDVGKAIKAYNEECPKGYEISENDEWLKVKSK